MRSLPLRSMRSISTYRDFARCDPVRSSGKYSTECHLSPAESKFSDVNVLGMDVMIRTGMKQNGPKRTFRLSTRTRSVPVNLLLIDRLGSFLDTVQLFHPSLTRVYVTFHNQRLFFPTRAVITVVGCGHDGLDLVT